MREPASRQRTPRRRVVLAVAGLVLLCVLPHVHTLRLGFALDDQARVVGNPHIGDWSRLPVLFSEGWRPLKRASLMLDHALWGLDPLGYHATNLLLHVAATLALTLLFVRLTGDSSLALVAGALFAVHPVHVEAIANISHRKEMMAALGYAGAFLAYLALRRSLRWLPLVVGLYAAAVASKEAAAVMLPAVTLLYELGWRRPRPDAAERRRLASWYLLAALGLCLFLARGGANRLVESFTDRQARWVSTNDLDTWSQVLANVPRALMADLRLLVWPSPLSIHHRFELATEPGDGRVVLAAAAALALLSLAFVLRRRLPWLGFGLVWTLVNLLPLSNLVPLTWWFVAERFLYLPSAGLCLAAASLLCAPAPGALRRHEKAWHRIRVAAGALVVLALAVASARRVGDWHDSASIIDAALASDPDDWRSCYWSGLIHQRHGDQELAESHFRRSAALKPAFAYPHVELARLHRSRGELSRAESEASEGVALDPYPGRSLVVLAGVYIAQGRTRRAVPLLEAATETRPHDPRPAAMLAEAYSRTGRLEQAQRLMDETLERTGPSNAGVLVAAGRIAAQAGRHRDAKAAYLQALEQEPDHPRALLGLADLAMARGRRQAARAHLRRLLRNQPRPGMRAAALARLEALERADEERRP